MNPFINWNQLFLTFIACSVKISAFSESMESFSSKSSTFLWASYNRIYCKQSQTVCLICLVQSLIWSCQEVVGQRWQYLYKVDIISVFEFLLSTLPASSVIRFMFFISELCHSLLKFTVEELESERLLLSLISLVLVVVAVLETRKETARIRPDLHFTILCL